jgi:hypothetical protein
MEPKTQQMRRALKNMLKFYRRCTSIFIPGCIVVDDREKWQGTVIELTFQRIRMQTFENFQMLCKTIE